MELDARSVNTFLKNTIKVEALDDKKSLVVVEMEDNKYHIFRLAADGSIEHTLYISSEFISDLILIGNEG